MLYAGEHTDWAGNYRDVNKHISFGMTIVCATNEGLHARCGTFEPMLVKYSSSSSTQGSSSPVTVHEEAELPLSNLAEMTAIAQGGGFFSYIAGTLLSIMKWDQSFADLLIRRGLYIDNYLTTLPMQKGLSSSAAVCVLVATCFSTVHGLNISTIDLMEIAYRGEMLTPSQCGRMDQCVAMGKDTIGLMTFAEGCTAIMPLMVETPLYFVVADLKAHKDTVVILDSLHKCFPFPKNTKEVRNSAA
jgi:galactokinase